MEQSEQITELAKALAAAQSEIEGAAKDGRGNFGKYATLGSVWDAARKALTDHGLSIVQAHEPAEPGYLALTTQLMHSSGQWMRSTAVIPLPKPDPQGYGSATTYLRRYTLAAWVSVCPDDDDANAAMPAAKPPPAKTAPAQRQAQTNGDAPGGDEYHDALAYFRRTAASKGYDASTPAAVKSLLAQCGIEGRPTPTQYRAAAVLLEPLEEAVTALADET